jgi:hypothetical protein
MDEKDIFMDRERALEDDYFRKQDAKLIEQLRERGRLEAIASALDDALKVGDAAVLSRAVELGITRDTGPAFLMAPLVQVAWAEGTVTDRERGVILRQARERGIAEDSPSDTQLRDWLTARPSDALFDAAVDAIKAAYHHLPAAEREEKFKDLIASANEVAGASGGLTRMLGLSSGVSGEEESLLDAIAAKLRGHRETPGG